MSRYLFRLWQFYFHAPWERDGRVYERLGIRTVGRFMAGGYYSLAAINRIRGRRHRSVRGRRAAYEWLIFTFVAELAHLFFFVVMLAISAKAASTGRWDRAGIVAGLNLVVNVIPVMVQRYNRARIVSALKLDAARVLDTRLWADGLGLEIVRPASADPLPTDRPS